MIAAAAALLVTTLGIATVTGIITTAAMFAGNM